jgi:peptidoglycan-N-acetylglucosamine deacetylase
MLNFRNTSFLFVALLLLLAGFNIRFRIPVYFYVIVVLLYSSILFYGSYYVGSNFFMKVLCSANTNDRQIAISFDDGPAQEFTGEVLEILKENSVPAAFFCIGKRIAGNEALLDRLIADGHIIGNHSHSHHFWFDLFSVKRMQADIQLMGETVKKETGLQPKLFRPPYGVTTPNMRKVMNNTGYLAIGWNIRSMDTVIKDQNKLLRKVTGLLQPGAIILLHDTSKVTVSILQQLINEVRAKGYEFVRLDKLLKLVPYA